jgi:hypothetical protein
MSSIEKRLAELESAVGVLETIVARLVPDRPEDRDYSEDLDAWVDDWLLPRIERPLATGGGSGVCWCPHWWDHPEAVARLEALRDAWTKARVGTASAMASWWIEKLDPTLRVILAADGPFARCREQHRHLPLLTTYSPADDVEA